MKAIQTTYRGTTFRSRLEARWAVFFDHVGVEWHYEQEGYETAAGNYLPDFWLPHVRSRGKLGGLFFEVKGASPIEGELHKANMLAWGSSKTVIITDRSPMPPNIETLHEFVGGEDGWHDYGLSFGRCDNCGSLDVNYYASDTPLCQCGKSRYNMWNTALQSARDGFGNFIRWEASK